MSSFIEVFETNQISELQLIKTSLNHLNIRYEVFGEQILYSGSAYAMGFSGARILVHPEDHADALAVVMNIRPISEYDIYEDHSGSWISEVNTWKDKFVLLKPLPVFMILLLPILLLIALFSLFLLII
jgi:hypothetical protein